MMCTSWLQQSQARLGAFPNESREFADEGDVQNFSGGGGHSSVDVQPLKQTVKGSPNFPFHPFRESSHLPFDSGDQEKRSHSE
jgi:hypothetical protein